MYTGGIETPSAIADIMKLPNRVTQLVLEQAQERKLRLGRLKGELVDRARTTALVFRLRRPSAAARDRRRQALPAANLARLGRHCMC